MLRIRYLFTALVGTLLLVATSGPALARPAPFDDTTAPGAGSGTTSSAGSDTSIWIYAGYALAVVAVILLVAVVAIALDRHAHHAPHPA